MNYAYACRGAAGQDEHTRKARCLPQDRRERQRATLTRVAVPVRRGGLLACVYGVFKVTAEPLRVFLNPRNHASV